MNASRIRFCLVLSLVVDAACHAAVKVPDSCPVTVPIEPRFIPPGSDSKYSGFWYGTKALWARLPEDGIWRGEASKHGSRNKFSWGREGWGPKTAYGDLKLTVTGKRLDTPQAVVQFSEVNNALSGQDEEDWYMMMMLEIPTSGCWEITGNIGADFLSFVLWVPPAKGLPDSIVTAALATTP